MYSSLIEPGVSFNFLKTDKFKTLTLVMLIKRPLRKEEVTKNALIPKVLLRGSKKYENITKISEKTEEMYGAIFDCGIVKKGNEQIIQFFLEVCDDSSLISEGIDFLYEMSMNPLVVSGGFSGDYVDEEKKRLKLDIEARKNDKREFAKLRCIEEMCKDAPFGVYADGYLEYVDEIEPKHLYEHYINIINNSNIDFFAVGDTNQENLEKIIRDKFFLKPRELVTESPTPIKFVKEKNIDEYADSAQNRLCIGLVCEKILSGPQYYVLLLCSEILGGFTESKLFLNIREKGSLCYYINSAYYRNPSILLIQSGVQSESKETALREIRKQINALISGDISEKEFKLSRESLIRKIKKAGDYPGIMLDFYLSQKTAGDSRSIDEVIAEISSITLEQCKSAAKLLKIDTIYSLGRQDNGGNKNQ